MTNRILQKIIKTRSVLLFFILLTQTLAQAQNGTRITGRVSDTINGNRNFKGPLITRYLVAEDLEGAVFSYPDRTFFCTIHQISFNYQILP